MTRNEIKCTIAFLCCTRHISRARGPPVASGYCIGQSKYGTFPLSQKFLGDSSALYVHYNFLKFLFVLLSQPLLTLGRPGSRIRACCMAGIQQGLRSMRAFASGPGIRVPVTWGLARSPSTLSERRDFREVYCPQC